MAEAASPSYITDVEFPSTYVRFQAPVQMSCAAALGGFRPPRPDGAFAYCELGCSFGATLVPLAAANPEARFVGVDFNPEHIRKATETARSASLHNVSFIQASFDELSDHAMPAFDYIATHGTFSWLTADMESALLKFVATALKPGGLFYVDYMSLPGKAAIAPLWQLLRALTAGHPGASTDRARDGLQLLGRLRDQGLKYFQVNPPAAEVLDAFLDQRDASSDRIRAVAHHALAQGWRPRYFTELAERLEQHDLRYTGSAMLPSNDIDLIIPPSLRPAFDDVDDPKLVELLKDFALNQQQRQDVFINGAEPDPAGADRHLRSLLPVMLRAGLPAVRHHLAHSPGKPIEGELFDRLLTACASEPRRFDELAVQPELTAADADALFAAFKKLIAADAFFLCARSPDPSTQRDPAAAANRGIDLVPALNRVLLRDGANGQAPVTLVSNVVGGGCLTLPPIGAALLAGFAEAGLDGAAEHARRALLARSTPLVFRGALVRPDQLDRGVLNQTLGQILSDQLSVMLTLGVARTRG